MRLSIDALKSRISPAQYYQNHLNGSLGKSTGKGWYKWSGLCPFHNDQKTGSFVINKESGAYKCFSCGAGGGDIISFHMHIRNLSFNAACTELEGGLR